MNVTVKIRDATPADASTIVEFSKLLARESEEIELNHDVLTSGVEQALAQLDLVARKRRKPKTGPRAARRQIKKAQKKVRSALKKLDRSAKADAVTKRVFKAMKAEQKALRALAP